METEPHSMGGWRSQDLPWDGGGTTEDQEDQEDHDDQEDE